MSTPALMPAILTPTSRADAFAAIAQAAPDLSDESVGVLVAQWDIESGAGARSICHGMAGIKGTPGDGHAWTFYATHDPRSATDPTIVLHQPPEVPALVRDARSWLKASWSDRVTCFRAYEDLAEAARDYVALLRGRYAKAWSFVVAGDPVAFGLALKRLGYFQADGTAYANELLRRYRLAMADRPNAARVQAGAPSGPTTGLGARCLDQARIYLDAHVHEAPGPANDPQVVAFLASCRRGGSPTAGITDLSGLALNLRDDSTAWCASFASFCLALGLQRDDTDEMARVPHGYRAAVAELVQDAKATGRWRDAGAFRPALGDLAIWARAGGDPRHGGTGHVGRVSWVGDATFKAIEGNHADSVAEVPHTFVEADLVGWIAY